MSLRLVAPFLALGVTAFAACGGGGEDNGSPQPGSGQLTDPAAVPSVAQIAGGLTFVIRDNGVQAPGGASTTVSGSSSTPVSNRGTYEIKPGDLCGTIAEELGVSVEALLDANRGTDCSALIPGTQLRIPGGGATPTPTPSSQPGGQATPTPGGSSGGTQYTIQPGDLCVDIAASYGVSIEALVAANNIDCDNLQLGQVITIP